MPQLHGLLAVQLALLSREHECQESVPIPGARNTETCNKRPRTAGPQVSENVAALTLNPSTSASPLQTVESCLFTKDGRCCLFSKLFKGFLRIPLPPWRDPGGALGQGRSLSLEPSTLCHHCHPLIYVCHKNINSTKLGVLSTSQMPNTY